MHPLKLKNISAAIGQEFDLSSETVEKLARSYYGVVQSKLSGLTHIAVDVPGLGVFSLKPRALARKMVKTKTMLEKLQDSTTIRKFAIRSEKLDEMKQLEKINTLRESESTRRHQIRQSRYDIPAGSLPKPSPDSGRSEESSVQDGSH